MLIVGIIKITVMALCMICILSIYIAAIL